MPIMIKSKYNESWPKDLTPATPPKFTADNINQMHTRIHNVCMVQDIDSEILKLNQKQLRQRITRQCHTKGMLFMKHEKDGSYHEALVKIDGFEFKWQEQTVSNMQLDADKQWKSLDLTQIVVKIGSDHLVHIPEICCFTVLIKGSDKTLDFSSIHHVEDEVAAFLAYLNVYRFSDEFDRIYKQRKITSTKEQSEQMVLTDLAFVELLISLTFPITNLFVIIGDYTGIQQL